MDTLCVGECRRDGYDVLSSVLQRLRYKHTGSNYFQEGKTITYRTPVLSINKNIHTHINTSHIRQLVVVVDMPCESIQGGIVLLINN